MGLITDGRFSGGTYGMVVGHVSPEAAVGGNLALIIEGDTISLLATDRYRMALKELTWNPGSPQLSATALVPAKVLNDTSRSMTAGEW